MESSFSSLPDPFGDRMVKEVQTPPNRPIEEAKLFPYQGKLGNPDIQALTPTNPTGWSWKISCCGKVTLTKGSLSKLCRALFLSWVIFGFFSTSRNWTQPYEGPGAHRHGGRLARIILRSEPHARKSRTPARHKLSVPGRLRRQRHFWLWSYSFAFRYKSKNSFLTRSS